MTVLEIENATRTAGTAEPAAAAIEKPEQNDDSAGREVRHEYTHAFPALLSQLGVSLLVSTYQAGKVVAVGVADGELTLSYHNFGGAINRGIIGRGGGRSMIGRGFRGGGARLGLGGRGGFRRR